MKKLIFLITIFTLFLSAKPALACDASPDRVYQLINEQRLNVKLKTLSVDWRLNASSTYKANDLITKNYWSHTSPSGEQFYQVLRKYYPNGNRRVGETLARGYSCGDDVVNAWMNSPSHKAVVLDKLVRKIGITKMGSYYVAHFAY